MRKVEISDLSLSLDWQDAFLILSLDAVNPYWPELGLDFSPEQRERIQVFIREYIEGEMVLDELDENEWNFGMCSKLITRAFTRIAEYEGEVALSKIRNWIEQRYLVSVKDRRGWWDNWHTLFYWLGHDKDLPVFTGIGVEKLAALDAIAERYADKEDRLEDEIEELEDEPKSAWDERQWIEYQTDKTAQYEDWFKDDPVYPRNEELSPLTILENRLTYWRFWEVWAEILDLLTADEVDALERWAKGISIAKGGNPESLTIPPEYRQKGHPR